MPLYFTGLQKWETPITDQRVALVLPWLTPQSCLRLQRPPLRRLQPEHCRTARAPRVSQSQLSDFNFMHRSALHWAVARLSLHDAILLQVPSPPLPFRPRITRSPPQRLCAATITAAASLDATGVSNVSPLTTLLSICSCEPVRRSFASFFCSAFTT